MGIVQELKSTPLQCNTILLQLEHFSKQATDKNAHVAPEHQAQIAVTHPNDAKTAGLVWLKLKYLTMLGTFQRWALDLTYVGVGLDAIYLLVELMMDLWANTIFTSGVEVPKFGIVFSVSACGGN